jgi:hypothetical protein
VRACAHCVCRCSVLIEPFAPPCPDAPPGGDDARALAAAVEADDEEGATAEEAALRVQMQADLAALGFTPNEVTAYLETLSLDAGAEAPH